MPTNEPPSAGLDVRPGSRLVRWTITGLFLLACGVSLLPAQPVRPCCHPKSTRVPGRLPGTPASARTLDQAARPGEGDEDGAQPWAAGNLT